MKRILAIILVLLMVLPLAVACSSEPEATSGTSKPTVPNSNGNKEEDLSKLAGKTPKQLYDATVSALGVMTEYEVAIDETSTVYLLDEPSVSTSREEYKVKNGAAYTKFINPSEQVSEIWFKDGYMYTNMVGEKQRTKMSAEVFASNYLLNISSVIFPLTDNYFTDKKFTKVEDDYELKISVTKEDYLKYLSVEISGTADYILHFDSKGVIKWAKISAICSASAGVSIELATLVSFDMLGEANDITVAGKAEDYRLAPAADDIDMSVVESLDAFVESDEQTNYVMLDVEGYGKIVIRLYEDVAPVTVANFKSLVAKGFYDGLVFHRVVKDFVIQSGDVDADGVSGLDEECIRGEFAENGFFNNLSHVRGVVSMARTSQNMDSASTQFFIMHKDYVGLDGSYGAFGFVVYGLDTVDAIAGVEVGENDKPVTDVVITSAKFVKLAD